MRSLCFAVVLAAVLLPSATHSRAAAQNTPHASPGYATSPDGIRIAYEAHGSGTPGAPALVFVHGWSCDRSYWNGQLDTFSPDYKVVAVDLAGHGESALGRKDWSIAAFGGDIAAVVKKLGLTRVILIGHSMGGDVIAEAARQLPGRVVGMIWVDVYKQLGPGRSPESVRAFVESLRPDFVDSTRALVRSMFIPASNRALVERIANDMSSAPPEVAIPSVAAARGYSRQMPHTLDELKLPVIAINPDNAPTDVSSMQQHGVEVVIMPGVGHFLFLEDPERFNGLLRSAIVKLARPQPSDSSAHAPPTAEFESSARTHLLTPLPSSSLGQDAAIPSRFDPVNLPLPMIHQIVIPLHDLLELLHVRIAPLRRRHHLLELRQIRHLHLRHDRPVLLGAKVGHHAHLRHLHFLVEARHREELVRHRTHLAGLAVHDVANNEHGSILQ
jgi:pimeloyl-ACP methyl ester carboxylesterase